MKIQDQVVLGQNPSPVISTTTTESMATKTAPPRLPAQETASRTSRYRAPALEKGLDVIELLAAEKSPLNLSSISQRLGRSSGELFRMLQVLEFKGFITTAENGSGYVLTNKLFALAMAQAPVRSLVETALPVMRKLVQDIGQSAHIAVRIGYRREIASATSGLVLFAYQNEEVRRLWLKRCRLKGEAADSFVERANIVRTRGYHEAPSYFVRGIVDVSAPILRGETAVAALTIPFVHSNPLQVEMAEAVEFVRAAAKQISNEIVHGDLP
jgi:DNA-binding IclR family transcriptional regulator